MLKQGDIVKVQDCSYSLESEGNKLKIGDLATDPEIRYRVLAAGCDLPGYCSSGDIERNDTILQTDTGIAFTRERYCVLVEAPESGSFNIDDQEWP